MATAANESHGIDCNIENSGIAILHVDHNCTKDFMQNENLRGTMEDNKQKQSKDEEESTRNLRSTQIDKQRRLRREQSTNKLMRNENTDEEFK